MGAFLPLSWTWSEPIFLSLMHAHWNRAVRRHPHGVSFSSLMLRLGPLQWLEGVCSRRLLSSLTFPSESRLLCVREESSPSAWCTCLALPLDVDLMAPSPVLLLQGVERPPPDIASSVCWAAAAGPWSPCSLTAVLGEEAQTRRGHTEARSWVWTRSTGPRAFVLSHGSRLFREAVPWGLRTVGTWCQPWLSRKLCDLSLTSLSLMKFPFL